MTVTAVGSGTGSEPRRRAARGLDKVAKSGISAPALMPAGPVGIIEVVSSDSDNQPAVLRKRPPCPGCGEPWLRPTQLPGRFRCVYCLTRYELVSQCPDCGEHQTIARMSTTEDMTCQSCGGSMLRSI